MQSGDGALQLLPALPDVWQAQGTVSGLRARGGFTLKYMNWKDGKINKLIIQTTLGGNLRLRIPNEMKSENGTMLKTANGRNANPFYQTETTADPIISEKAIITVPVIKDSFVYDLSTKAGQEITLILK